MTVRRSPARSPWVCTQESRCPILYRCSPKKFAKLVCRGDDSSLRASGRPSEQPAEEPAEVLAASPASLARFER